MIKGMFWMVLAYGLSQFYRACLAVFAPALKSDIGVGADDISNALGIWFLVFAGMQIPVGWALDTLKPRLLAALLLGVGGTAGALVFAAAQGPGGINLAMALIGLGCSPVLMTSYYVFARMAPPQKFGTLAGFVLGVGSLGNLFASAPLSWSVEAVGWRVTMIGLAVVTLMVAGALLKFVPDTPPVVRKEGGPKGSILDILRIPAIWPILLLSLVNYAPAAGIRGSWAGPYFETVHGLGQIGIGNATLVMAVAMIAGSLAYGPAERLFRNRKTLLVWGNAIALVTLLALWAGLGDTSVVAAVALFTVLGFSCASYPQIMNHGRALMPPEITGRGITLINLFSIGGVGLFQIVTARLPGVSEGAGFSNVFGVFAVSLAVGLAVFTIARSAHR